VGAGAPVITAAVGARTGGAVVAGTGGAVVLAV
jgi:hypothetical protein